MVASKGWIAATEDQHLRWRGSFFDSSYLFPLAAKAILVTPLETDFAGRYGSCPSFYAWWERDRYPAM